jgi:hypothetical protein
MMKMMIIFATLLVGIVAVIFIVPIHGCAAAILLGIVTIGFDILWQWLRFTILAHKTKYQNGLNAKLLPGIITGFVLRMISIFVFLKLGSWWLTRNEFFYYAIFLLTLPLWSKLAAYKFKTVI